MGSLSRAITYGKTNVDHPGDARVLWYGGPVVVAGVTTRQGGRESRLQGEGDQVTDVRESGRSRDAGRRNGADVVVPRQARPPLKGCPAAVQPAVYFCLRAHLRQPWRDAPCGPRRSAPRACRWPGSGASLRAAPRALPVPAGEALPYIPKKNGKKRPLGLPPWSDKIVGEVIRLLLEAYTSTVSRKPLVAWFGGIPLRRQNR